MAGPTADVTRTVEGKTFTLKQLTSGADSRLFQLTNPGDIENDYKGVQPAAQQADVQPLAGDVRPDAVEERGHPGVEQRAGARQLTSPISAASQDFGQNPNDYVNADGLLIGDRPVLVKAQLVYDLGWGMTLAGELRLSVGQAVDA